jgi:hypothetical protein
MRHQEFLPLKLCPPKSFNHLGSILGVPIRTVQIGRLPSVGRPPTATVLTQSCYRHPAGGRRYRFCLPTSVRSVGEMSSLKSVFVLTVLFP